MTQDDKLFVSDDLLLPRSTLIPAKDLPWRNGIYFKSKITEKPNTVWISSWYHANFQNFPNPQVFSSDPVQSILARLSTQSSPFSLGRLSTQSKPISLGRLSTQSRPFLKVDWVLNLALFY